MPPYSPPHRRKCHPRRSLPTAPVFPGRVECSEVDVIQTLHCFSPGTALAAFGRRVSQHFGGAHVAYRGTGAVRVLRQATRFHLVAFGSKPPALQTAQRRCRGAVSCCGRSTKTSEGKVALRRARCYSCARAGGYALRRKLSFSEDPADIPQGNGK